MISHMILLRSLMLALVLAFAGATMSHAQAPADLPAGMTQEQFDALVDAISKSVAEKLKAESIPAAPSPPTAAPASEVGQRRVRRGANRRSSRVARRERPDEFAIVLDRVGRGS